MNSARSMTGFGRAEGEWRGGKLTVEVRSLNHRYFEVRLRLPNGLRAIEPQAVDWAKGRMSRGRVEVNVTAAGLTEPVVKPGIDMQLAKQYAHIYSDLAKLLGSSAQLDPALILSMRDVILMQEEQADPVSEWESVQPVFEAAFDSLDEAAYTEAEKLVGDIRERLARIAQLRERMIEAQPGELAAYRDRLKTRISQLIDQPQIDPDRLAQELAYHAERCDFTEESVRLAAHIERFGEILEGPGPMGRKLDFMVQEMMREINTASSKALNADISQMAVEVKAELEKIREQIQNIE